MSSRRDVVVPAGLAEGVPELFGARGVRWLAELPDLVEALCRDWDLTVVGPGFPGGTHSYVAPVRSMSATSGRRDALVLKVPLLDEENYAEAAALRCYAGDGAVRLHRVDLASGALLLERADPGHALLDEHLAGRISAPAAIRTAADLLGRLSRPPGGDLSCPRPGPSADGEPVGPVPPAQPFPLVREAARHWSTALVETHLGFGRPYDHGLFTEGAGLAAELAGPTAREVIVNRDAHLGNILAVAPARGGWLLIDPKPMLGPPSFDAGHLVWDLLRFQPTVPQARLLISEVAAGLAVDPAEVRAWGLIRVLSNISWAYPAGVAQRYVEVATALAGAR